MLILISATPSYADNVVLDNKGYSREELIDDFLNVAFSDTPWNADAGVEDLKNFHKAYVLPQPTLWERVKKYFIDSPSFDDSYMARHFFYKHRRKPSPEALMQRNLITKWGMNELKYGIDWPVDTILSKAEAKYVYGPNSPYEGISGPQLKPSEVLLEQYDVFYNHIVRSIVDLMKFTDRDMSVLKPDSYIDRSVDHARIRIVPYTRWRPRSWLVYDYHDFSPDTHEARLMNGVLFQSYTRGVIDGYLLPVKDHSVDMAICKVMPNMEEERVSALLNECMVRTLGLPGFSFNANSLLSHWHTDEGIVDIAKRSITRVEIAQEDVDFFSRKIPEYDRFMIALLYCPQIKSGMTQIQVKDIFESDKLCFERAINFIKEAGE